MASDSIPQPENDMTDIDELLEQARTKATSFGQIVGAKEVADDELKTTYALIREDAPQGSVADMDAWVKRQPEWKAAVEKKRDAYAKFHTANIYLKVLFAQVDVWRSKESTNRFLDKAHQ